MKKFLLIIGFACLIIISGVLLLNVKVLYYNNKLYVCWQESGVFEKAEEILSNSKLKLIVPESNKVLTEKLVDLGFDFELSLDDSRDSKFFISYFNLEEGSLFYLKDSSIFYSYLSKLNDGLLSSSDAYAEITSEDIIVHQEVRGTKFDIDRIITDINDGTDYKVIDLTKYVIEPTKLYTDYNNLLTQVDKYEDWSVTYTNGYKVDLITILSSLVIESDILVVNEELLKSTLISNLKEGLSDYNTIGIERSFTTQDGDTFTTSRGTYGDKVNYDSEVEYLVNLVKEIKSEDSRIPIYSLDLPDTIGNTYIEVSIDQQHLWYYVDGNLFMETDIVTGTKGKYDTPIGFYYITEKIGGKYLVGDNYKTWVNQWMRLTNSGIGLHDAYWRGKFGGTIYTYNGSHGCINLPKDFAEELFKTVSRKTAVIIY